MAPTRNTSSSGLAFLSTGSATSKQAIIFVHGWSCRASDFNYLLESLASSHPSRRYLAPYLPGHGEPDTIETRTETMPKPSVPAAADLVLSLIAELGIKEATLVGHSMGTRIVFQIWNATNSSASQHSKVATPAIVLLDGSHHRLRSSQTFASSTPADMILPQADAKPATSATQIISQMFSPLTPPAFRTSTLAHVTSRPEAYFAAFRKSYMNWDVTSLDAIVAEVGRTDTKVLVVQSTDVDSLNRRRSLQAGERTGYMRYIEGRIPRAEMVVVEGCGHWPHVDKGADVAGLVRGFVSGVWGD